MPRIVRDFTNKQIERIQERVRATTNTELSEQVIGEIAANPPQIKPFPWSVVLLNALLDIISIAASFSAITGVGLFLYWILKIIVWVTNAAWYFGKAGPAERAIKRAGLKALTFWALGFILSDPIPFNDFIFPNCLFIILIHNKETAIGKAVWDTVGEFATGDIPGAFKRVLAETRGAIIREARNRQQSGT